MIWIRTDRIGYTNKAIVLASALDKGNGGPKNLVSDHAPVCATLSLVGSPHTNYWAEEEHRPTGQEHLKKVQVANQGTLDGDEVSDAETTSAEDGGGSGDESASDDSAFDDDDDEDEDE